MTRNFRDFEAGPDPFGKKWRVELVWLQTAISIRHSDSVDVKFFVSDGERTTEKVVALPHATLRELSERGGRRLSDEKTLLMVMPAQLARYAQMLEEAPVAK